MCEKKYSFQFHFLNQNDVDSIIRLSSILVIVIFAPSFFVEIEQLMKLFGFA